MVQVVRSTQVMYHLGSTVFMVRMSKDIIVKLLFVLTDIVPDRLVVKHSKSS